MNLQALKDEFDADLASMSHEELIASLESIGCVFEEPWLDFVFEEDAARCNEAAAFAANSNELALAA